ncbi:MAG: aromatic amino acid aminotransferase [Dehalococcoidales bacterium]|jgi:aminotransferase|nr:aromatic amino acid aminotransferase [Dehalococcoidales bacterium]
MSRVQYKKYRSPIALKISQIAPSGIRKFFELLQATATERSISLGIGEPDFVTPWHIREAAIRSLEKGPTGYTSNLGMPELRQELSRYLKDNFNLEYDPASELLITVGVSEALDLAIRTIIDPGDEVIMPDPCFISYKPCVILAGGIPVLVPTNQENNFELNAADIEARITNRTKAILIGYPANPTGAVLSKDKLTQIAELARRHQLLVISDEIYAKLVYGVKHTCLATLPRMKENTILLNGFSKAFAMTGWRIGYAAATKEIITAMNKVHQSTLMCAPRLSQVAAIEALKTGEADTTEMVKDYNQRRMVIVKGFNDIGLSCFESRGSFFTFPSIKSTDMNSEEFAEKLLFEEQVAVVPGTAFGECGEGYIRCCYATSLANIEEALSRMKRFVDKHRTK